jgi:formate dehydrogenase iron-sulfur subunit
MPTGTLQIKAISGHSGTVPGLGMSREEEICKYIDVTTCIGCKACEVACVEWNEMPFRQTSFDNTYQTMPRTEWNYWNLIKFNEHRRPDGTVQWLMRKDQCMHCEDPGCLRACPSEGAIVQYTNGIVDFHEENCIGCGYCITGCPFNIPRISKKDHRVYKCTLCSDRVAVGQEPACVKTCPTGAIVFGTKEDMKQHAAERIVDLKERGFENAGLYDPQGVGGTHVMYVLHHADRPSLYHGLPDNPRISPLVGLWKGIAKPLAVAGIALTALAGFFHYTRVGPNEVTEEEELAARDEARRIKEPSDET